VGMAASRGSSAESSGSPEASSGNDQVGSDLGGVEVEFQIEQRSGEDDLAKELEAQLDAAAGSLLALIELHHATRLDLDHYSFLGIERGASLPEIDAAYQVLAPRYRTRSLGPEASPEIKKKAKTLLARLVGAFSELSDPARRRAYDRLIERDLDGRARSSSFGESVPVTAESSTAPSLAVVPDGIGIAAIDLSDWLPGGDDTTEVRRRCARLDEVDAEKLREARRAMAAGAFETAYNLFDQLRERDPSDVLLLADIGWCQFSSDPDDIRSVDKAIEWLDLGLAFEPSNARALSVKTRILCYAGREEEAHANLRRLAPLMPETEWVRLELARRNDSPEEVEKARGLRRFWGGRKS